MTPLLFPWGPKPWEIFNGAATLKWAGMPYSPQMILIARTIKESIYIRVNNPTLNRNISKFNLHHIWDRVLLNTPGLKIKKHVQDIGQA